MGNDLRGSNMSYSTNTSSSSGYTQDSYQMQMKARKFVSDDINNFITNEFDEILEK